MTNVLVKKTLLLAFMLIMMSRSNAQSISYVGDFDLNNLQSYSGVPLAIGSEEGIPEGITFSPDGLKMFISGQSGDEVNQYSLTTPFNTNSGVSHDGFYSVAAQYSVGNPRAYGVAFSNNGTKMFVTGTGGSHEITQYDLTSAFDITSTVAFNTSYDLPSGDPNFIEFNNDGTKMYVKFGSGISQYSLSVGFDLSSTIINEGSYSVGYTPEEMVFSADGKTMLVLEQSTSLIHQYDLTAPYVITSGVTDNSISAGVVSFASGIAISNDDAHLFIVSLPSGNQRIRQYDMLIPGFTEAAANDGTVDGSSTISISEDTFTNQGSTLALGSDYSISNLPAGLTPSIAVTSGGQSATLTITGNANDHQDSDDLHGLEIIFENSAFTGNDASLIYNSDASGSSPGIDFEQNKIISYGNNFNIEYGIQFDGSSYTHGTSEPYGITFNNDGTKMYYIDQRSTQRVYQYSLAHPYQLSGGVTSDGGLAITGETSPRDVTFSADGSKMFVIGQSSDNVHEYTLNTSFDITDGWTYEGSISAGTNPRGLAFSPNGSKMFVIAGSSSLEVSTFELSEPYNIQTRTSIGAFSLGATTSNPAGLEFSQDGHKMYILDSNTDAILQYSLDNAYNTSSGVFYDDISIPLPYLPGGLPFGLAVNGDGTSFYVADYWNHNIMQYNIESSGFKEAGNNKGSVSGFASASISGGSFSNAGGMLTLGSDFTLNVVPSGLTPSLSVNANAKSATLEFSGNADSHMDVDDLADLEITFLDGAFSDNDASGVTNPTGSLKAGVDFRDNNATVIYGNGFDPFIAEQSTSFYMGDEEQLPLGITFNTDGTKMYMAGYYEASVFQYSLSVAFDVSTAAYDEISLDVSEQETRITGLILDPTGTTLFVVGTAVGMVNQYSLTTPFDLSTASFTIAFDPSAHGDVHGAITFNDDGSKMYLVDPNDDQINQYSLETPYDVSGNVDFDGNLNIGSYGGNPNGIALVKNGKWLIFSGSLTDRIRLIELEIPFDITSETTYIDDIYVQNIDQSVNDVLFNPDGSKMYMLGASNGRIYEFDIELGKFKESGINDGSIDASTSIPLYLSDELFTNADGILTHNVDYTINNLPSGLTPSLSIDANGQNASLSFTGNSTSHQNSDDVAGLIFTFNNSAFEGGDASAVANASATLSSLGIDFRDNNPALYYGDALNLANTTFSGNTVDILAQDGYATGISFNNDGTRFFISGGDNSMVYEYSLSSPYDLSSTFAYTTNSLDISTNASYPEDLTFSPDGTRLFIVSSDNYEIVQYNLSIGFDLSTATHSSSYSVESIDQSAYGLTLSSDGTKMYILGSDNYNIYQFSLSTPFELSTISYDGSPFFVEDETSGGSGLTISQDGRHIIVVGDDGVMVRYSLYVPFDITAGADFDGVSFDLTGQDEYSTGVTISPNGGKIFVVGYDAGIVSQYDVDLGGFTESAGNDGTIEGDATIFIADDQFTNAGGTLTHGVDYSINNLPAGLAPSLIVEADGYSATLTFSGVASSHGDADDVSGLQFTFANSAFSTYESSAVAAATNYVSTLSIEFLPYTGTDILTFELAEQNGPAVIDNDGSSTVTMEVMAGTDISALTPDITVSQGATVSPASGAVQDFTSSVTYTITAEDGGTADMEVTVTEEIATPTDILLSSTSVDEKSSSGAIVGTLSTLDDNFEESFNFYVVAELESDDWQSFDISGNNLITTDFIPLDFETKNSFTFNISVQDNDGEIFEKEFTITLNDVNEAPTNIFLSNTTIDESNPIGTSVGSLTAEDVDQSDVYAYSLKEGNTDNASFAIDGDQLVTAEILDFETKNTYNLEIIVSDQGGLTFEQEFAITVNDLPKQITSITLSNNLVDENLSVGTVVGTLSTFGEDLSGSFTYDLVSGSGDVDNGSFSISGDQLLTTEIFDYESQNSYSLRVMTDDGDQSEPFILTVSVNDISEAPTDIMLSTNSITENNAINDVIGLMSSADDDAGESFTYDLVTGTGDTNNASFNITGDELIANEIFDFESQSSYSVRIETNDGNGGTYQKAFTISISDENESIVVVNPLADQSLNEGFITLEIDLSNVFEDEDNDALSYSVSSSNTSVATVSNSGATLTITEVGFGTSSITVTADDGSGITTSDAFEVTVIEVNEAPIVANSFPDGFSGEEGFGSTQISYANVFSDPDGDELIITVSSGNESVVTTSLIANNQIQISEVGPGESTITVTADDGNGGTVSDSFTFTVTEAPLGFEDEIAIEVYPNPTVDFVNIRANGQMTIHLTDLRGQAIKSGTGESVRMDLRQLKSGIYIVKISTGKSTSYKRIIKAN
ncbi:cadherin domain-containing protein [Ekhidna sp.]|uniref:cadherin domain-containing protein n=1 Tax=Ekhidna sp. TaxID=2608089 RepID=UPI00329A7188